VWVVVLAASEAGELVGVGRQGDGRHPGNDRRWDRRGA
jgi:hypothetical protein